MGRQCPNGNRVTDRPMQPNSTDREPSALTAARRVARFCDTRIGWNRIGFVLSVSIIAIAVFVLYRILRDIEVKEVFQALVTVKLRDVALAALFVAGGYFTLTF